MAFIQSKEQSLDISSWYTNYEEIYPEGARDKDLIYCPSPPPAQFLEPKHGYLFKLSSRRYPEQFWVEIFAYLLGKEMQIEVAPAFVAYNSRTNTCGALIHWFLRKNLPAGDEESVKGGDDCQRYIVDYDRKKGAQHNFQTVSQIFDDLSKKNPLPWREYWAKTFLFDALIGNTDRHQENWSTIKIPTENGEIYRIAPIFDNGTSMGHEILPENFLTWTDEKYDKYIMKGTHHMKWEKNNNHRTNHSEFVKKFIIKYPETQKIMVSCLERINETVFRTVLDHLISFDIPVKLSEKRADFMLKLLNLRYKKLIIELS